MPIKRWPSNSKGLFSSVLHLPAHNAAVRQVISYFSFDGSVKLHYHGGLLVAFSEEMLNTVAFCHALKIRGEERFPRFGL